MARIATTVVHAALNRSAVRITERGQQEKKVGGRKKMILSGGLTNWKRSKVDIGAPRKRFEDAEQSKSWKILRYALLAETGQ